MNCPTCGNDNREGANFCRMCGAELAQVPATVMPAAIEAEPESSDDAPAAETLEIPSSAPLPETDEVETALDEPASEVELEETDPAEPLPSGKEADLEGQESLLGPEPAEEPELEVEGPPAKPAPVEATPPAPVSEAEEDLASLQVPALEAGTSETAVDHKAGAEVAESPEESEIESPSEAEPDTHPAEVEVEDTMPLPPVAPGTEIAGRYVIVEASEVQDSKVLYLAHDMLGCWQCGYEGNTAGDDFCAQCGAQMDRRPEVLLLEVRDPQAESVDGRVVAAELDYEERRILLLAEAEPEARVQAEHRNLRLVVGQQSDPGQVRALDEDSLLALTVSPTYESISRPLLGLFAVADGMGGHEGGEVASKLALQVLAEDALRTIILPELAERSAAEETVLGCLQEATVAANDAVYLARQKRENDMGTTLTTVFIRDDRLFFAHVGDCRVYRWDAGGLEQLTTDHSLVASMVASGQAKPEEIYTHPHRSVIYRCIGDKPMIEVDTGALSVSAGDRIIVCCDGLWEMIRDEGIQDVMMQEADPQTACDLLVSHANMAGGEDNISVIVIQIEEF